MQIARRVRNQIESGVLRNGQTLPSTREIAHDWGVSLFTVSEAMKILTSEGLISAINRSKRIVIAPTPRTSTLRPDSPWVVLVGGYAGSGKTEFTRSLARETGWALVDKDTVSRPLTEELLQQLGCSPNDRESELYLTRVRPFEYEALQQAISDNLECGNSVIATAPFLKEFNERSWLDRTGQLGQQFEAKVELVWILTDPATMHQYIRQRGAARDSHKLANWSDYLQEIDVDRRPLDKHTVVENSLDSDPLRSQALRLLEKWNLTGVH